LIEPLNKLFKDEVRQVGTALGIPDYIVWRQPFPGPGLAIRVLGEVTEEKLAIVRESDWVLRDEIAKAGLERERSEEHTSELQSRFDLVCRLLLEKKNNNTES